MTGDPDPVPVPPPPLPPTSSLLERNARGGEGGSDFSSATDREARVWPTVRYPCFLALWFGLEEWAWSGMDETLRLCFRVFDLAGVDVASKP